MKKRLIIVLAAIVLCVAICAATVFFIFYPAEKALNRANDDLSAGNYAKALDEYCAVLSDGQNRLYGRVSAFTRKAAMGIDVCVEKLALSDNWAVLTDHPVFELCDSILAEAGEAELKEEQTGDEKTVKEIMAEVKKYQTLVQAFALEAEGRYTEAISLYETLYDGTEAARDHGASCESLILLAQQNELLAQQNELLTRQKEEYSTALSGKDFAKARGIAEQISDEDYRALCMEEINREKAAELTRLQKDGQNLLGAGAWYTALLRDDGITVAGDERYEKAEAGSFGKLYTGDFGMLTVTDGVPAFFGDTLGADKEIAGMTDIVSADVGMNHALLVHSDGTVSAVGAKQYGKAEVSQWKDIAGVAAGGFHSVAVTTAGTVLSCGLNTLGQGNVSEWADVIAVDAGMNHTVALLADGTAVACGDNTYGQCDVTEWKDIVSVACGMNFTVGLRSDGTVVACGDNSCGQCNVEEWKEVFSIAAGCWHTAGIVLDGRVVSCGANDQGQCEASTLSLFDKESDGDLPSWSGSDANEFVYIGDDYNGPWVYYSGTGAVSISLEDSYELVATRADLYCTNESTPEGILSGGGDKPTSTVPGTTLAKQNKSVFAINGDYYNFDYNPDGIQLRCGILYKNEGGSLGFAFYPDGTMRIVDPEETTAEELQALGIRDSWVFGPTLILDGEVQDISWNPLSHNDVTLRSGIGSACAYHHIAVSCGKGTLAQLTQLYADYGCVIAYNLDGGRSVWMTFMGKRVNRTYFDSYGTRNLSDMVGFLHSDLVQ